MSAPVPVQYVCCVHEDVCVCMCVSVSGPLDKRPKGLIGDLIDSAVGHHRCKHIHSVLIDGIT